MWGMVDGVHDPGLAFPQPRLAMTPGREWWEADLGLDVQQLEPAIPDLQEQVLAPHPALSVHLLQLLQNILGLLDSLCPQLTCHQVLRGQEEMGWEKVWRGGSQVGMERAGGGGRAAEGEDMSLASSLARPQAIPIKQSSRDNMRAGGSQARMGLPRWGLMGCRRGFRTLEEEQSSPVTVCCC